MFSNLRKEVLSAGRRAWPDVELDPHALDRSLGARNGCLAPGSIRFAADLYLACACLTGNPRAIRCLESLCRDCLKRARRCGYLFGDEDDAVASVLAKLLVRTPAAAPRLSTYDGRTQLRAWLQVILARHLMNLRRQQWRETPLDQALLLNVAASVDLPWHRMDARARESFRAALAKVLAALPCRDRNLLRHRLDGLDIRAIGLLYQVHPSTAWRWLARVHLTVEHAVRRELGKTLRLSESDVASLLRSLLSQVDSSICREVSNACQNGAS